MGTKTNAAASTGGATPTPATSAPAAPTTWTTGGYLVKAEKGSVRSQSRRRSA